MEEVLTQQQQVLTYSIITSNSEIPKIFHCLRVLLPVIVLSQANSFSLLDNDGDDDDDDDWSVIFL